MTALIQARKSRLQARKWRIYWLIGIFTALFLILGLLCPAIAAAAEISVDRIGFPLALTWGMLSIIAGMGMSRDDEELAFLAELIHD